MTLRVAHVSCFIDGENRGPEELLAAWPTLPAIAEAAARAGAEVTVLQASRHAAVHDCNGVRYRFVVEPRPGRGGGAGWYPWRLALATHRETPDVVHFHGLDFPFHARALDRLGVPLLVQDHASRFDTRLACLRRWGYAKVAAVAFTSAHQSIPFVRGRQLPHSIPVFEIPESSSHFTPGDRADARAATGVFGYPAILWIGHLDRNKDPLTIVHAIRKILPLLPELQLWCAFGHAGLLGEIEALLRSDLDLAAHVHLLGKVPHERVELLCRSADMFVSASRREGSGYALIEALACALPCVVSDIPPFRALTGGGRTGALAPVGDVEAFAAAMLAVCRSPQADLRRTIITHFAQNLSFDAVGARLFAAYCELAAIKRAQ